jgi:hypothetical protein
MAQLRWHFTEVPVIVVEGLSSVARLSDAERKRATTDGSPIIYISF